MRRFAFYALILIALSTSGCALRGRRGLQVPAEYAHSELHARMIDADPQVRQQAAGELFAPLSKVHTKGKLIISGHWWQGKDMFYCFFLAQDPQHLRLRGFLPQANLFDVIVQGEFMTVLLHRSGDLFQGYYDPVTGSPFRQRFGIEPGDLMRVLTVGQMMADGQLDSAGEPQSDSIRPESVQIDKLTGLPRRVVWGSQAGRWEVTYRSWDYFSDAKLPDVAPRLLPARVQIESNTPKMMLDLTIEGYQLDDKIPPKIFKPVTDYRYIQHPLRQLEEIFE